MGATKEKKLLKMQQQLARLEKEKVRFNGRYYFGYLLFILSLIYIMDAVTTAIGGTVQSSIVTEFFVNGMNMDYNRGLASFGFISSAFMLFAFVAPFYKTLSDRFGRKPFLAINTMGMGVSLLICYTSQNIIVYMIGVAAISFFIPHDMQVVYVMETAPHKYRGTIFAFIKCISAIGTIMIPILRNTFMGNDPTRWRMIYVLPGLASLAIGLAAMFTVKESPHFLKTRIEYLQKAIAGKPDEAISKGQKKGSGISVPAALKFMFSHRQLRWLSITNLIFFLAMWATGYYESIMTTGGMSTEQVTRALFVYPFVNAGLTLLNGVLADRIGRKKTAVFMGTLCVVSFVLFIMGSSLGWSAYLVGALYGGYWASYWSAGDIVGPIMCGESAPTRLRASVIACQSLLMFLSTAVSMVVLNVLLLFSSNLGLLCLFLITPIMVVSLIVLTSKAGDTTGINLETVTGEEWDKNTSTPKKI